MNTLIERAINAWEENESFQEENIEISKCKFGFPKRLYINNILVLQQIDSTTNISNIVQITSIGKQFFHKFIDLIEI